MILNYETRTVLKNILRDVLPYLDEKQQRLLCGSIANSIGHGGIAFVNSITGKARNTISSGMSELEDSTEKANSDDVQQKKEEFNLQSNSSKKGRIRREGGGRKSEVKKNPELLNKIEEIISANGATYGDPQKTLRWTTWSLRKIAKELLKYGIKVSQNIVSRALDVLGYSKQQNQKMFQVGKQHPDRDAQFKYINDISEEFLNSGEPVISIDTKKKENLGNFKNNGAEYRPIGDPRKVLDHDFPLPELGKVAPYGVYVLNNNTGFVNLGTSHDTPNLQESVLHSGGDM